VITITTNQYFPFLVIISQF